MIYKYALKVIILLCFINTTTGNAQKLKIKDLVAKDYISDLILLKDIIEKEHPDPYRFFSKQDWEDHFEKSIKSLNKKPTYLNFLNCIPKIGDGHFSMTAEEFYQSDVMGKFTYFPIPIIIIDNHIFVNTKDTTIPFLSEIIEINGKSVPDIIYEISKHVQGEGSIKSIVEDSISDNFWLYYSIYIESNANNFNIKYKDLSLDKSINLRALNFYEVYYKNSYRVDPINRFEVASKIDSRFYKENLTGKLTVNTFDISEQEAYQKFKEFFTKINEDGYKNVIIDLRCNGGGDPQVAAILYSFIATNPFKNKFGYIAKSIKVFYPEFYIKDDGSRAGETEIENYENFINQRFDLVNGHYESNNRFNGSLTEGFPVDKLAFKGNVYVLTSGRTFSSAVYFSKLMRDNKRGIIIGKETGGNANSTFAGYFLNYKLPKTKAIIRFSFTDLYFEKASQKVDEGIIPDKILTINEKLSYLLKEEDPEVTYVQDKLIK